MLRLFVIALTIISASSLQVSTALAGNPGPDQLDYQVRARYQNHSLRGQEVISFRNNSDQDLNKIWLRLWANGPKGCARKAITIKVLDGGRDGSLVSDCTALPIGLVNPIEPGQHGTIKLAFQVTTPKIVDRFGRVDGIDLFGSALPLMAVRDSNGFHYRSRYSPDGESVYSLTGDWQVTIKAPSHYTVASSGQPTPTDNGTIQGKRLRDFFIAIGPMKRVSRTIDGVEVNVYGSVKSKTGKLNDLLASGGTSLNRFGRWFGPYNYGQLDIVYMPDRFMGGMEYPGIVLSNDNDDVSVHEVAHQWFYAMIGNDQYSSPWLDESFAEYAAQKLLDDNHPGRRDQYCLRTITDTLFRAKGERLSSSMSLWNRPSHSLNYFNIIYDTGSCYLNRLDNLLGPKGDDFWHEWYQIGIDKIVTNDDFIALTDRYLPNNDQSNSLLKQMRLLR